MDNELQFPQRDEDLTAALRTLYAAPAGEQYWAGLEQRIMARIADNDEGAWWNAFEGWKKAGMVAAVLIIALIGLTLVHFQNVQPELAIERLGVPAPLEAPNIYTQSGINGPRDANFGYVIKHY
jgi:hypothetical protein